MTNEQDKQSYVLLKSEKINDSLYYLLLRLPKKNLLHLMLKAVDTMQFYNEQPIESCIIAAGGSIDPFTNEPSLPPIEEIKKNSEDCPSIYLTPTCSKVNAKLQQLDEKEGKRMKRIAKIRELRGKIQSLQTQLNDIVESERGQ